MSRNNPYDSSFDDYVGEYTGQYTPLFDQQKPKIQKKSPTLKTDISALPKQQSAITKTVDAVKDKTESVIEEITGNETLSDKSRKESLSPIDYMILLSSVYGIGAAVGITTAAGKNIMPESKEKPILYWSMIGLGVFGAIKGFKTVSNYKNLREQLKKQTSLEKALEDRLNRRG